MPEEIPEEQPCEVCGEPVPAAVRWAILRDNDVEAWRHPWHHSDPV